MELNDRVVLITGGKRIGQVVARELAARGAHIAVSYRGSRAEAESTASEARAAGRKAAVIAADVGNAADCAMLVQEVVAQLGRLDVLVNMASIYQSTAFDVMTEQDWQRNIDVNLRSVFLCAKAAVPHMRKQGGGRIINFADWLARSGRPAYKGFVAYYTAKAVRTLIESEFITGETIRVDGGRHVR